MIYKTLTKQEFINEFGTYDEGYANYFSYDGLSTLYDYFDDIGYSDEPSFELDVIGICCEFTEYENLEEMLSDYPDDYASLKDIENATLVLPTESGGFVIQQF